MNAALQVMAALGGVAVFLGAVWALLRGIIKQNDSTRENTAATNKNTKAVEDLKAELQDLKADHNGRLRSLEDWRRERDGGYRR